ncbi:MAG: sulfurtransferase TusA family protein [Kofleriaceae bacterium]
MTTTTTVDCRGMACPEPVLRTARAAKQLAAQGGMLEVLADDDAFPADVRSWCRSAGAALISLEPRGGAHRALIQVASKAPAASASGPVQGAVPLLDFRGKQCPEPVLGLARHARTNPGLVEVVADDPAFRPDLEAWCKNAGAVLEDVTVNGALVRAKVRVPARRVTGSGPTVRAVAGEVLDCRGKQCPEPVLALARFARANPGATVDVLADDPAFDADVEAWCRSAGASAIARTRDGGALRVTVQLAQRTGPMRVSTPHAVVTPPPALTLVPDGVEARFDWRGRSADEAVAAVKQLGQMTAAMTAELQLPDAASTQAAVKLLVAGGHDLVTVDTQACRAIVKLSGAPSAELALVRTDATGLVRSPDSPDCTLLVLHNDLETLLAAMLVANGAAASGMKVLVFFTFWGLNALRGDQPNAAEKPAKVSFFQRMFKWMMPKGPRKLQLGKLNFGGAGSKIMGSIMKQQNINDLPQLMRSADELGVRFVACTMSMSVMGITKRDLHPYSTLEYAGVATFVDAARNAEMSLVF